mmetsp:Transcript_3693/g.7305  ORF Transcript_3693/g.7305 Transcript_3693/m.7305 type:complete len:88 (+) Transcript_3693:82-345(+)
MASFLDDDATAKSATAGPSKSQGQPPPGWTASGSAQPPPAHAKGPSLPFRVRDTRLYPKGVGAQPVYALHRFRVEDAKISDAICFTY